MDKVPKMYLLLLFMYFGAIICTNPKIHFFEKHIQVLENAEIQKLFSTIDDIRNHTNDMIDVSQKMTFEMKNERKCQWGCEWIAPAPQVHLTNIFRNILVDLDFCTQKLYSLGFRKATRFERGLDDVIINTGVISNYFGIASVSNIQELKKSINEAILEIRSTNNANDIRTEHIIHEFEIIRKMQQMQLNISDTHDFQIFSGLKLQLLTTRIKFMILNLQVTILSSHTGNDFLLYTDKINQMIDQEIDRSHEYALFRANNISDIRDLNGKIDTTIDNNDIVQRISIPVIQFDKICNIDSMNTTSKMVRAYCPNDQFWVSATMESCIDIKNEPYCNIRPCKYKSIDKPCYTLTNDLFLFQGQTNCTDKFDEGTKWTGKITTKEDISDVHRHRVRERNEEQGRRQPTEGESLSMILHKNDSMLCQDFKIEKGESQKNVTLVNSIINWDDILDNISLNSGKKSATSYETLDNF